MAKVVKKFVVLRSIHNNNIFYTVNCIEDQDDITKLDSGEVVYVIVGYANSKEEVQAVIRLEYKRLCTALNDNLCSFLMPATDVFIKDRS